MSRGRKPLGFSFMSYDEAKAYLQKAGIKTLEQWQNFCKNGQRPPNMPSNPNLQYKDKWTGMPDFLGYQVSGRGRKLGTVNATKVEGETKDYNNVFEDRPVITEYFSYEEACQRCQRLCYTKPLYLRFIANANRSMFCPGTVYARLPQYPETFYENFNEKEFYYQKPE